MQNIWAIGILLSAMIGTGAVVGMGVMSQEGMHHGMHGLNYEECLGSEDCEYEHEECQEHYEEDCYEDHEECESHEHHEEHMEEHGCAR